MLDNCGSDQQFSLRTQVFHSETRKAGKEFPHVLDVWFRITGVELTHVLDFVPCTAPYIALAALFTPNATAGSRPAYVYAYVRMMADSYHAHFDLLCSNSSDVN